MSTDQLGDIKHCIGLNKYSKYKKKKGIKHYEAYRNYYAAGYKPNPSLEELVKLELMETWTNQMGEDKTYYYYCVSKSGLEFLEKILDIKIIERD